MTTEGRWIWDWSFGEVKSNSDDYFWEIGRVVGPKNWVPIWRTPRRIPFIKLCQIFSIPSSETILIPSSCHDAPEGEIWNFCFRGNIAGPSATNLAKFVQRTSCKGGKVILSRPTRTAFMMLNPGGVFSSRSGQLRIVAHDCDYPINRGRMGASYCRLVGRGPNHSVQSDSSSAVSPLRILRSTSSHFPMFPLRFLPERRPAISAISPTIRPNPCSWVPNPCSRVLLFNFGF